MSQANILCFAINCRYNPTPGVGYCEHSVGHVVLGFVEMVEGAKETPEPRLQCWSYEPDDNSG